MSRATRVRLDLGALVHNLQRVRTAAPGRRVASAVKAEGYGHGLVRAARALASDVFAVACVEEALILREAGIEQPILLLEGVFEAAELPLCARYGLEIAVHHPDQARMLEVARLETPVRAWLKIDTGMHRLGLDPDTVAAMAQRLRDCPSVRPELGMMSHLARADERDSDYTRQQLQTFEIATSGLNGPRSLANSAGVLGWPQTHFDLVRPGIMLYGASPFVDSLAPDEALRPVMTLHTRLITIKRLHKGDPVGYGGTWSCPEDMDVGVAAVGYGDGYPRHAPSGTPVLLNGREAALIGRVSMDMISLDLRRHPEARIGDPVVLWGEGLPVERVAQAAGTISYTLLCGVTARVPRDVIEPPTVVG
ncbi:MAG TPA: alanine racemase [Candidatus Competibacteraceae bacterium]|nr:alanine racemase [Candidatus Competibacteraceae bacterium]HQA26864.1 alanine racemase [Candidatus Competibacteraceae bacterium]HQD57363.1 alanine racemase [Candidatus Competibacteraceae bacterium]